MRIEKFSIKFDSHDEGVRERLLFCGNACECGCSPYPYVTILGKKNGVFAEFETPEELEKFQSEVAELTWSCTARGKINA